MVSARPWAGPRRWMTRRRPVTTGCASLHSRPAPSGAGGRPSRSGRRVGGSRGRRAGGRRRGGAPLWWAELRPQREEERRDALRRWEATEGVLAAFDQLDAINRAIADAPDWPAAHTALTA